MEDDSDILPRLLAQSCGSLKGGLPHGRRRIVAEQGGRVLREGTPDRRSATRSVSSRAGPQLSQVRRGDRGPTIERPARKLPRGLTASPRLVAACSQITPTVSEKNPRPSVAEREDPQPELPPIERSMGGFYGPPR